MYHTTRYLMLVSDALSRYEYCAWRSWLWTMRFPCARKSARLLRWRLSAKPVV
ncbi:hypothetical protein BC835DRAFT_1338437 [Cytidiella melzeri]|nr:hypothetical protein BC835DRAFT_1338437 [Cytidiella melzeri]